MPVSDSRPFAVITRASSGIGRALAHQFAAHGFDLLITAEDGELDRAAGELARHGPAVQEVVADLATEDGAERVVAAITATGRPVDALALNAGIGNGGAFTEIPLADEQRLLAVNIGSTVHLAKRVLPGMVQRGAGRVLFTSSVASQMPGPYYATYAASKAFIQSFAHALRHELDGTGVTVTALLPGPTDTEFFDRAGMEGTAVDSSAKDDPADVARDGFEALMAGQSQVVAGSVKNKIQVAGAKIMPDRARAAVHAKMTKPEDD
ncbi:MAG: SDR family NAD(P)-dependent oxidoreductase [Actinobacteria bacterium]|nr:SDR family NAD(P)-dependent oxidoreductase [Actinomycetota bacterium]